MEKKKEWDQLAEWYQSKDSRTDWLLGYPMVLEALGDIQEKRVLDYGCGNGSFSRFLVQNFPLSQVIGIDTSDTAIAHAKSKTDHGLAIEYHLINDYQDISAYAFDAACFNFVFCTIPNFETIINICKRTYQQLPHGGRMVVLDPHPTSHGKRFTSFESETPREYRSGESIHVKLYTDSIDLEIDDYYWTEEDYRKALTTAGFTDIAIQAPILRESAAHATLGAEKTDPPFIIIQAIK